MLLPVISGQGAQDERRPVVAVIHDASPYPTESASTFASLVDGSGSMDVRLHGVTSASALRESVRNAEAPVLVLAAHGERAGLVVNGELIPWALVSSDLAASGAREVVLLACYSANVGFVAGVRILQSYGGLVDLEVAALDGVYAIAEALLTGSEYDRSVATVRSYAEMRGGGAWVMEQIVRPARPLDWSQQDCTTQWTKWNDPNAFSNDKDGPCKTMYVNPENPTCNEINCNVTPQEQNTHADEIKTQSSAKAGFAFELLNDYLSVSRNAVFNGREYDWWVSLGNMHVGGEGVRTAMNACLPLFSVERWLVPGYDNLVQSIPPVGGVRVLPELDLFELELCGAVGGGILKDRNAGTLAGTIEARLTVAGIGLSFNKWGFKFKLSAELVFRYPLTGSFDFAGEGGGLAIDGSVTAGPATFTLKVNMLSVYMSVEVELFAKKEWTGHWQIGGQAASGPGPENPVDQVRPPLDAQIPSVSKPMRNVADVMQATDGGTYVPVSDTVTVVRTDAFYNYLENSGAFHRLGIDVKSLGPHQAIALDLANPEVYRAIYDEDSPRPPTLQGIPGGFGIVPATQNCDIPLGLVWLRLCEGEVGAQVILGEPTGLPGEVLHTYHTAKDEAQTAVLDAACGALAQVQPELCPAMTRLLSAAEGSTLAEKALESHLSKILTERNGQFLWLTDSCSHVMGTSVPGAEPVLHETGACGYLGSLGARVLHPLEVYLQFSDGLLDITGLADAEYYHAIAWYNNNIVPLLGPPPIEPPPTPGTQELECLIWQTAGLPPPDCQG